jgi:hypothetical protein
MTWNRKRYGKNTHLEQKSTELCVVVSTIFWGATLEPGWKWCTVYLTWSYKCIHFQNIKITSSNLTTMKQTNSTDWNVGLKISSRHVKEHLGYVIKDRRHVCNIFSNFFFNLHDMKSYSEMILKFILSEYYPSVFNWFTSRVDQTPEF